MQDSNANHKHKTASDNEMNFLKYIGIQNNRMT